MEGRHDGFPIVDAGMRELQQTGLMHNRVRMITAMFLTKDLHLDWRLGEQFFMQSLVDGKSRATMVAGNGVPGTGADAAPYFRIQNPWTQTKRYDPTGDYIRHWVPELDGIPGKVLATPRPLASPWPWATLHPSWTTKPSVNALSRYSKHTEHNSARGTDQLRRASRPISHPAEALQGLP